MLHKLLHLLPPERSHQLTLWGLQHDLGPTAPPKGRGAPTRLFGRSLSSPVGLAAGADKNAVALAGWQKMGFGFVEAGTVTLHPRRGNPKPRLWRRADGESLINWMGLNNHGLTTFYNNLAAFRDTPAGQTFCVGASLATPDGKPEELAEMARKLAPLVDYLAFNGSCPNVKEHDKALQPQLAQLEAIRSESGRKGVLVKLAPTRDLITLKTTARTFLDHGASGFIACNTLPTASKHLIPQRAVANWPQHKGEEVGGLSSPALAPLSRNMVQTLRSVADICTPIIGVGGIDSPSAALKMLESGANAIQLYTALTYQGPELLWKINAKTRAFRHTRLLP